MVMGFTAEHLLACRCFPWICRLGESALVIFVGQARGKVSPNSCYGLIPTRNSIYPCQCMPWEVLTLRRELRRIASFQAERPRAMHTVRLPVSMTVSQKLASIQDDVSGMESESSGRSRVRSEDAIRESGKMELCSSRGMEFRVEPGIGRMRLDAFLTTCLPGVSRARIQASVREGLVQINGQPQQKVSGIVRQGDSVVCVIAPLPPSEAIPEDIPIVVVYEDAHLLVVDKAAHMVVHPSAGHQSGTLVNALLHHCRLPSMRYSSGAERPTPGLIPTPASTASTADLERVGGSADIRGKERGTASGEEDEGTMGRTGFREWDGVGEEEDEDDVASVSLSVLHGPPPVIRPGIVHRLDKGTSGLIVIAKDERTHNSLCEQFKARTVRRSYVSVTCGVPSKTEGRVVAPIGRDPRDRKRMAALLGATSAHARHAASRYRVLEVLGAGGCALVEWRLETGRTHQIRVHAKHIGHPLLGDDTYGGSGAAAVSALTRGLSAVRHGAVKALVARLERPSLHARTLGFVHPWTQEELFFTADPPPDFLQLVGSLRSLQS